MIKRERDPRQGWAKHKRNLDGGPRLVQKRLRRAAKKEIVSQQKDQ